MKQSLLFLHDFLLFTPSMNIIRLLQGVLVSLELFIVTHDDDDDDDDDDDEGVEMSLCHCDVIEQ